MKDLKALSSRKIVHVHGIGGDGEYCGGNDAQLDRIDVFTTKPRVASTYHAR